MSIYNNLYDLLVTYVFGGQALNSVQELSVTLVALCGCLFLVALPFILVWKVIRIL